ncbi:hypothetical protein AVEN_66878-1, partial [Araneus ventricosus]
MYIGPESLVRKTESYPYENSNLQCWSVQFCFPVPENAWT